MPITDFLAKLVGGSVGDAVQKIVGTFHVDPALALEKKTELEEIQLQLQGKLQDALSNEVTQAAEVIKAEATSQSWLPRNVRPLLLLLWGMCITFNYVLPLLGHFVVRFQAVQPLTLPDWLYKLTAIGFTGYVTARTWEKVTNSDN